MGNGKWLNIYFYLYSYRYIMSGRRGDCGLTTRKTLYVFYTYVARALLCSFVLGNSNSGGCSGGLPAPGSHDTLSPVLEMGAL